MGAHQQAAEAAADHHHLDLVGQGLAGEAGLDVGIVDVAGELPLDLDVLLVAVVADPLVTLLAILRAEGLISNRVSKARPPGSGASA
jgi:hypothetical protein